MTGEYQGDHARVDRRSMAMHRAMAEKLRADCTLLEIAHDNLRRWMAAPNHSQPYFEQWRRILARPLPEILERMTEDSETMTALRQCSPFAGVLTPKERWAIYGQFAPATREGTHE